MTKVIENYVEVVKLEKQVATNYPFKSGVNTAVVAGGGAAGATFTSSLVGIYVGSGAPTITAPKGSIYTNTTGSSTSTRLYVNTDGATTWANVTTSA